MCALQQRLRDTVLRLSAFFVGRLTHGLYVLTLLCPIVLRGITACRCVRLQFAKRCAPVGMRCTLQDLPVTTRCFEQMCSAVQWHVENEGFERNDMFINMLAEYIKCVTERKATRFDLSAAITELQLLID